MHSDLLLAGVAFACLLRLSARPLSSGLPLDLRQRWYRALSLFLMPPLLLATTAFAVVRMGHHGQMLGHSVGRLGCHLALVSGVSALVLLLVKSLQTWHSLHRLRRLPLAMIQGHESRWIETPLPMAACLGWWKAELLVSSSLTEQLDDEAMDAVLLHEQAHLHFRDTFWFFWLDWIRGMTCWLPQTHNLWQELLLLRELRADRWAAQFTDPLLLAETLLALTQATTALPASTHAPELGTPLTAYFTGQQDQDTTRLEARIQALLAPPSQSPTSQRNLFLRLWMSTALLLSALPLLSSLYHCAA